MGLDVVKNVLEDVGGNLYIHSEKGKGTTFTIVVPLSLATMECIRFRVGDCDFPFRPGTYTVSWIWRKTGTTWRILMGKIIFCMRTGWCRSSI